MTVPIYALCYQNAKWLEHLVAEMRRTLMIGRPDVHIWDDGSDDPDIVVALAQLERETNEFRVHRQEHLGYREQFIAIGERALSELGLDQFYCYVEDDVQFCVNWHAYATKVLLELTRRSYPVGVLAFYTGHPAVRMQVLPHAYELHGEHFYGTCGLAINTSFVPELAEAIRTNLNPDIAIRELLGVKQHSKWCLYVVIPTLVQHLGKDTRLNAPFHQSGSVLHHSADAMRVLL